MPGHALPGSRDGYPVWDILERGERNLRHSVPLGGLCILDEIHEHRGWRD